MTELGDFSHGQTNQPDDQPDVAEQAWLQTLAEVERARALGLPLAAEARLEFLKTIGPLDDIDFFLLKVLDLAFDNLPAPDFPPGLPPKLQQLLYGQDYPNDSPPPDAPQPPLT